MKHISFIVALLVNSILFAQPIELVRKSEIKFTPGLDLIIVLPGQGILQFNKLDKNLYNSVIYDFELNKKSEKKSEVNLTKRMSYLNTVLRDDGIHMYFSKQSYIGFFPKTKVDEILIDNKNKLELYHYKMKNFVKIMNINKIEGQNVFSGFEMYKPWGLKRVSKFAFGWLLYPIIIPARPNTRPFLATLEEGKLEYINRKEFKSSKYRNMGIHDVKIDKDDIYLGVTSGVIRSKTPIKIVRTNTSFSDMEHFSYRTEKLTRINTFQFNNSKPDSVGFDATTGLRLFYDFTGAAVTKFPEKKKLKYKENFAGNYFNDKVSLKTNKNQLGDKSSNEVYSSTSNVNFSNSKIRKTINNQDIEVVVSEKVTPIYEIEVYYSVDSKGRTTRQTRTVLVGYTYTNLQVNLINHTKNISKTYSVDPVFELTNKKEIKEKSGVPLKFYHYLAPSEGFNTIKHSVITYASDGQFYLSYLHGLHNTLTVISVDFDGFGEEFVSEIDESFNDTKTKKRIDATFGGGPVKIFSKVNLQTISEKEYLLIKVLSKKIGSGKKKTGTGYFKELSIYKML